MDNKYSKEIESIKQEFIFAMNIICMSVDFTNLVCDIMGNGLKVTEEYLMNNNAEITAAFREAIENFKKFFNDKNNIIMRYILERSIGEPFYIMVESPEEKGVVMINSAGELFDFLFMLKQVKSGESLS